MSPHHHGLRHPRRRTLILALAAVAAVAVVATVVIVSAGGVTGPASSTPVAAAAPAPVAPAPAAPVSVAPPPVAPAQHYETQAAAIPAGDVAMAASLRVDRDRAAAAASSATVALQHRLDQATDGQPLYFAPDTTQLLPSSQARLPRVVAVLNSTPGARVELVGSTAVEIASPPLCLQLSQLRAEQVMNRLALAGIDPDRIPAVGVSHMQPRDTAALSRRVELLALPS